MDPQDLSNHVETHFCETDSSSPSSSFVLHSPPKSLGSGLPPSSVTASSLRPQRTPDPEQFWDVCAVCDEPVQSRHMRDHVDLHFRNHSPKATGTPQLVDIADEKTKDDPERTVRCTVEYCQRMVPLCEWQEHQDFHTAEALEKKARMEEAEKEKSEFASLKRKHLGPDATLASSFGYSEQYLMGLQREFEMDNVTLEEYFSLQKRARNTTGVKCILGDGNDKDDQIEAIGDVTTCRTGEGPSLIARIAEIVCREHVSTHKNSTLDMYLNQASSSIVKVAPTRLKPLTPLALLSHTGTRHLRTDLGDTGWGCGYRNAQMLLSCLAAMHPSWCALLRVGLQGQTTDEELRQVANESNDNVLTRVPTRSSSFDYHIPEVTIIQRWIEEAWKSGFDPQGAAQLENRLQGTRKWIGTTEIYTVLTHRHIPCAIVDFRKDDRTFTQNVADRILDWIEKYFRGNRISSRMSNEGNTVVTSQVDGGVLMTNLPPLYLQHQGHSQTVVGIRISDASRPNTRKLMIFDPGRSVPLSMEFMPSTECAREILPNASSESSTTTTRTKTSNSKRQGPKTLPATFCLTREGLAKRSQYQIIYCTGAPGEILTREERRRRMTVSSENA